jgi:hydroxymethylbilane synthase
MYMIKIGTRGSALALWQANYIAGLIGRERTEIIVIRTKGDTVRNISFDKMEGKGFFTKEIEEALLGGAVDCAVHSLKDLPVDDTPGLALAAITAREDPSDVLLIRSDRYDPGSTIPVVGSAVIGTSSLRRAAQILHEVGTLRVKPLRGNVPTRVKRLRDKKYDAIILARAGLKRLETDLAGLVEFTLPYSYFLPAPGQGALAIQVRADDGRLRGELAFLNDDNSARAVRAERAFLNLFGAGCHVPLGALAFIDEGIIHLSGVVASADGSRLLRESVTGHDAETLGAELARLLKDKGADSLL